ncbi:hypothetical protein HDU87_006044 [Geranomyces variabilis]|uniref:polynucleotide adenylyltransferase n=1 Tax=Geranomyces variabilis TaxID=109894 RepID=A0AAD5XV80_9FUNG|nr:hypothetical protein HDU87_006044 [Geranomyces variabilis]
MAVPGPQIIEIPPDVSIPVKPSGSERFADIVANGQAGDLSINPFNWKQRRRNPQIRELDADSEMQLTMEINTLSNSLALSKDSYKLRMQFVDKVQGILDIEWPGKGIKAHVFGSTVNGLGTQTSDVDLCLLTSWTDSLRSVSNVHVLATGLKRHGMTEIYTVAAAKVPICKFYDPEYHVNCDINVNNPVALRNTELIKEYVKIDSRVRPMMLVIKFWTRQRKLNDAAKGGTLSSYCWAMMRYFAETHSNKSKLNPVLLNGVDCSFHPGDDYVGFGSPNKETLGGLVHAFFRFYAEEFDYESFVISVRHGCCLTKAQKGWDVDVERNRRFLCVEEPFNTQRNLANSADAYSIIGLRREFDRGASMLSVGADLDDVCEPYVPLKEDPHRKVMPMANHQQRHLQNDAVNSKHMGAVPRNWQNFEAYRTQAHKSGYGYKNPQSNSQYFFTNHPPLDQAAASSGDQTDRPPFASDLQLMRSPGPYTPEDYHRIQPLSLESPQLERKYNRYKAGGRDKRRVEAAQRKGGNVWATPFRLAGDQSHPTKPRAHPQHHESHESHRTEGAATGLHYLKSKVDHRDQKSSRPHAEASAGPALSPIEYHQPPWVQSAHAAEMAHAVEVPIAKSAEGRRQGTARGGPSPEGEPKTALEGLVPKVAHELKPIVQQNARKNPSPARRGAATSPVRQARSPRPPMEVVIERSLDGGLSIEKTVSEMDADGHYHIISCSMSDSSDSSLSHSPERKYSSSSSPCECSPGRTACSGASSSGRAQISGSSSGRSQRGPSRTAQSTTGTVASGHQNGADGPPKPSDDQNSSGSLSSEVTGASAAEAGGRIAVSCASPASTYLAEDPLTFGELSNYSGRYQASADQSHQDKFSSTAWNRRRGSNARSWQNAKGSANNAGRSCSPKKGGLIPPPNTSAANGARSCSPRKRTAQPHSQWPQHKSPPSLNGQHNEPRSHTHGKSSDQYPSGQERAATVNGNGNVSRSRSPHMKRTPPQQASPPRDSRPWSPNKLKTPPPRTTSPQQMACTLVPVNSTPSPAHATMANGKRRGSSKGTLLWANHSQRPTEHRYGAGPHPQPPRGPASQRPGASSEPSTPQADSPPRGRNATSRDTSPKQKTLAPTTVVSPRRRSLSTSDTPRMAWQDVRSARSPARVNSARKR